MLKYKERILEILNTQDLSLVTPKYIRLRLQEEYNIDLSSCKSELKSLIFECLDSLPSASVTPKVEETHAPVVEKQPKVEETTVEEHPKVEETVVENAQGIKEKTKKRKSRGGFQKVHYLSTELATFLNKDHACRTQVTKEVWNYIKEHGLQDERDKRYIKTDDKLMAVLKKKRVHMFEMTKILSSQIKEAFGDDSEEIIESSEEEVTKKTKTSKKSKVSKESVIDSSEEEESKTSKKSKVLKDPAKKGGFHKEYKLSEDLAKVLKMETSSRPQVVKKLWEYIKELNLQDPEDKRFILTDEGLFKVFGVERLNGFKVCSFI